MEKKKITINVAEYPGELHPFLANANIYDSSCSPNAQVLYSDLGFYIKIAEAGALGKEAELAMIFAKKGLGAEVVMYLSQENEKGATVHVASNSEEASFRASVEKDYLVTRVANGEDGLSLLDEPERLCEALVEAMKYLHSQSIEGAPISNAMEAYAGKIEDADDTSTENVHKLKCDTLIHGDFCLPNIMFNGWKFSAFIDLGLAGVGDKHIDIYWVLWSLNYNLKTNKYTDYVLDLYGRKNVDMEVLKLVSEVEKLG